MPANLQPLHDTIMDGWSRTFALCWTIVVALFLVFPLVAVLLMSLSAGNLLEFPPKQLSLRWYQAVFHSDMWLDAALNSLSVALLAATLGTPAGAGLAIAASRLPTRAKLALTSLALGPMIMPVIVMAIALFFALAPYRLIGSQFGLGLAHSVFVLPLVFIATATALEHFNEHLLEAAESLGAKRWYAVRTVLLPFLLPAIIVGALLAFTASLDEAVIAIFVGGGRMLTIPSLMWRSLNLELSPEVAAVSAIIAAFGLSLQFVAFSLFFGKMRRKRRSIPS